MKTQSIEREPDQFRALLRNRLTPITYQTWFRLLRADREGDGAIRITAPSAFHVTWLREKHWDALVEAVTAVYGAGLEVVLDAAPPLPEIAEPGGELEEVDDEPRVSIPAVPPAPPPEGGAPAPGYTFDNFVVGNSNRFAHAAAQAVSEQPGGNYNPLFIYSPAGLGKTHLLHAVRHNVHELHPEMVTQYVSSEKFFNDFIDGIRRKRMAEFKDRYRTIDVLLLDDVQFFEGKEQILEEFFHTFNTLHQAAKQLVITSDRHPRSLSSLEDRLRSRFQSGLLVDIQPPDFETRLAILERNAELSAVGVPPDVLAFIADHVSDNIRELDGALTRVTAFAALTGHAITLDMAADVLQDLVPRSQQRRVTAEEIIAATAAACGMTSRELVSSSRRQPIVRARQIAMYLCRELTDLSLPKIGVLFGGRDHTTVLHSLDRVRQLLTEEQAIFDQITALSQQLRTS